jgi:hypothetical protein
MLKIVIVLSLSMLLFGCKAKEIRDKSIVKTYPTTLLVNCDSTSSTDYILYSKDSSYTFKLDSNKNIAFRKYSYRTNSIILYKPNGNNDTLFRVNKYSGDRDTFKISKCNKTTYYFIDYVD